MSIGGSALGGLPLRTPAQWALGEAVEGAVEALSKDPRHLPDEP
jgi:hypothetical protein